MRHLWPFRDAGLGMAQGGGAALYYLDRCPDRSCPTCRGTLVNSPRPLKMAKPKDLCTALPNFGAFCPRFDAPCAAARV
mgnify:FL=1